MYLLKKYLKLSVPNVKKQDVTNLIDIVLSDLEKNKFVEEKIKEHLTNKGHAVINKGYDGLVYKNAVEDAGSTSYVAFSRDQIRVEPPRLPALDTPEPAPESRPRNAI